MHDIARGRQAKLTRYRLVPKSVPLNADVLGRPLSRPFPRGRDSAQRKAMNLLFLYHNAKGETKRYEVANWVETGYYIEGFSLSAQAVRTFRKDRVLEYLNGGAELLADPHPSAPPKIARSRAPAHDPGVPQILFTGFGKAHRAHFEQLAASAGLRVTKTVTQALTFLCTGPNAGPKKVAQAKEKNVYILTEQQLLELLATGELPDACCD